MDNREKAGAVIVAAGASERMGRVDKLSALIAGKPLLARVIDTFQQCKAVSQIVLVASKENLDLCHRLIAEQRYTKITDICLGGKRRQDSVAAGLSQLNQCHWVIIHDGARPLVSVDLIKNGLYAAKETGASVAAVPVIDTIKIIDNDRVVQNTPPRQSLWAVQTPQVFRFDIITKAYQHIETTVTDDATLVERLGYKVKLYMGSYDNIKITTPIDLILAEALLDEHDK